MTYKKTQFSKEQKGFTILELLIATSVFSVVLLLCATAIVQVGRMYYKSTVLVRTMETTRAVSDDVSQAIQFGARTTSFYSEGSQSIVSPTYGTVTVKSYCLGEIRYSYSLVSRSLGTNATTQLPHILWKDRISSGATCNPVDITQQTPPTDGQELLGGNMRLPKFEVLQPTSGGAPDPAGIWTINLTVAYGATDDLFTNSSNNTCIGSIVGGQYCGVSSITTNATKRL